MLASALLLVFTEWITLDDEIDAGVVTAESVGGHAGKEGQIAPFQFLDTKIG